MSSLSDKAVVRLHNENQVLKERLAEITMTPDTASRIVNRIVDDITSRRGIGDEWEEIENDVEAEIRTEWADLILVIATGQYG